MIIKVQKRIRKVVPHSSKLHAHFKSWKSIVIVTFVFYLLMLLLLLLFRCWKDDNFSLPCLNKTENKQISSFSFLVSFKT